MWGSIRQSHAFADFFEAGTGNGFGRGVRGSCGEGSVAVGGRDCPIADETAIADMRRMPSGAPTLLNFTRQLVTNALLIAAGEGKYLPHLLVHFQEHPAGAGVRTLGVLLSLPDDKGSEYTGPP